jgi:hypothetical protein
MKSIFNFFQKRKTKELENQKYLENEYKEYVKSWSSSMAREMEYQFELLQMAERALDEMEKRSLMQKNKK